VTAVHGLWLALIFFAPSQSWVSLPVAIPQTVANAGAINLFIVGSLVYTAKTTRVLCSMMMSTRSKVLAPVTWGSNALPRAEIDRVRDASSTSRY
jgi:hypothetical protein